MSERIAFENSFALDTYAAWHDATFPTDRPLLDNLRKLREDLVANCPITTMSVPG